jgi:hypothetical protein
MFTAATRFVPTAFAGLGLLIAAPFAATAAPPNPDRAAALQQQADGSVKSAEQFDARAEKATGELADSLKNVAAATRQVADAYKALATAVDAGNDEDIKAAQAALTAASTKQRLANEQANVRQTVSNFRPQEGPTLDNLRKATQEANRPLLDALLAAKTSAVEAGATFYAVLTSDTNPVNIEAARDLFIQAQNELEVANLALQSANARAAMASKPGADQAAAAAKLAEIEMFDREWLTAKKAALAAMLQLRALERSRSVAASEFETLRTPPKP